MEESATKAEVHDLREKLDAVKRNLAEAARIAKEKVVDDTTQWVKAHPVAAASIAAGIAVSVGFAIGLLVGRNRN